ncbi:MAG: hypothetical protein JOZ86_04280 [Candidatus Eremiobacteraeota bacterium]|nr:hypothetical protein [Candidatus Eremiobacteraeota bacterium]
MIVEVAVDAVESAVHSSLELAYLAAELRTKPVYFTAKLGTKVGAYRREAFGHFRAYCREFCRHESSSFVEAFGHRLVKVFETFQNHFVCHAFIGHD